MSRLVSGYAQNFTKVVTFMAAVTATNSGAPAAALTMGWMRPVNWSALARSAAVESPACTR